MPPLIAVVTDSTAYLPAVPGVTVVPLQVVVGDRSYDEGSYGGGSYGDGGGGSYGESPYEGGGGAGGERSSPPVTPDGEASSSEDKSRGEGSFSERARRVRRSFADGAVSRGRGPSAGDLASATTSRPSPARFAACYASLAEAGAKGVVSIHLSGEMSGTVESARAAARDAPVPVEVIDSRSIAMGVGYPVLAAARAAASGASLEEVTSAARRCAESTRTFFYVDTLDYLRRSGRIGTAASLFGSALMIKPLLHIVDGHISLLEKVRTSARAIVRLEDLAVQAAGEGRVEVAVQHLAARARAEALAERLPKRVPGLMELRVVEVGPVIGAHVGPGMLGLTVTPSDFATP